MSLSINLIDPTQAHKALQTVWHKAKAELMAGNKQMLTLQSFEEAMTDKQRYYYHGYVLTTIAQQAVIDGRKYSMKVFKEHYREKFLGDRVEEVTDIKTGATRRELQRISTESLSVKKYNILIEQVTADAATEFGVVFDTNFNEWLKQESEIA